MTANRLVRLRPWRHSGPFSLALLAGLVLAVLLIVPVPFRGRASSALMDLGHAPAFALLAWLVCLGLASYLGTTLWSKLVWVALPLGFCGLGAEFVQSLVGRGASWHDARANLLGAVAGVVLFQLMRGDPRRSRYWLAFVSAGLIALASIGPILSLVDIWRQEQQFPVLASFVSGLEMDRFVTQDARLHYVESPNGSGDGAMRIELQPGQFPGVAMVGMQADWSGYQYLSFDIVIDHGPSLPVIVKIHDEEHRAHHFEGDDRYDGIFEFEPGRHHIRISLDEVRDAPRTRPMNMSTIDTWQLFSYDLAQPRTIVLDDLRLE